MATVIKFIVIAISLFVVVCSKDLHSKHGNLETKDKDGRIFMNLLNAEELSTGNERYARHIQTVTESAIDHLLAELQEEYKHNNNYKSNSPVRRLIRNITDELQRRINTQKRNREMNKSNKKVIMSKDKQKQKKAIEKKAKVEKKTTKKSFKKPKLTTKMHMHNVTVKP